MSEQFEIRVHGAAGLPTLIYLPGLHGDWTLIGNFRRALRGRVRFVEVTYPRSLTWSLEDYAREAEAALTAHGITGGWLLGESFGSQVVWPILGRRQFQVEGAIFAGGFARHPLPGAVRLAEWITGGLSLALFRSGLGFYARLARFRFRRSPEMLADLQAFIARRTGLDRQAIQHRLRLIAQNQPDSLARQTAVPVYALTGLFDPIVPWFRVRRWLRRQCPALREYRIIRQADHNVLSTAPGKAAEQVVKWMTTGRPTR